MIAVVSHGAMEGIRVVTKDGLNFPGCGYTFVSWWGSKAATRPSFYISHKDTKCTKGWPDRPLMGYKIVLKGGIIAINGNKVLHVHCLLVGNKSKDVSIRGNKFLCSLCRGGKPCCCVVVGQESRYAAFLLYFPQGHKGHERVA